MSYYLSTITTCSNTDGEYRRCISGEGIVDGAKFFSSIYTAINTARFLISRSKNTVKEIIKITNNDDLSSSLDISGLIHNEPEIVYAAILVDDSAIFFGISKR